MPLPVAASLERLADSAAMTSSAEKRRMLIIANPYATTMSSRLKHLVVYALKGRYDVEAIDTQRPRHAIELCREAANEGYDVVVAFGGDGTVNEAANGLVGSGTPLTCLPGGATNVYCKMLGIPGDVVDATEHLLRMADNWEPRSVDLASVNGRHFTFSAGIGLDASVVERVDRKPLLKARYGPSYFTYVAVRTFVRRYLVNPPRLLVDIDGETYRGVSAMVQNGDPYTYYKDFPIRFAEGNTLDSGFLNGLILERASPVDIPTVLFRALSDRARVVRHRRISDYGPAPEIVIRSEDDRTIPVHVDGDYIGDFPEAVFTIRPGGLRVIA